MNKNKKYLSTLCACMDEDENIWIVSNDFNALFCFEKNTSALRWITTFDENNNLQYSYNYSIYVKGRIYFFPNQAKKIAVYEIKSNKFHYISLGNEETYFNVVDIGNESFLLYPINCRLNAYLFDTKDESIKKIRIDYEKISRYINKSDIIQGNAFLNGKAYFAVENKPYYFGFDINSLDIDMYFSQNNRNTFNVISDGSYIYVLLDDGNVIERYKDDSYIDSYKLNKNKQDIGENKIWKINDMEYILTIIYGNNTILCIPMGNNSLKLLQGEKCRDIDLDWEKIFPNRKQEQSFAVCIVSKSEEIYLLPFYAHSMVKINIQKKTVDYFELLVEDDLMMNRMNEIIKEDGMLSENLIFQLPDFINSIVKTK